MTQVETTAVARAGWYPDAEGSGISRYWDGNAWTEHRSPFRRPSAPAGIYPDPRGATNWRRWDGSEWREPSAPPPTAAAASTSAQTHGGSAPTARNLPAPTGGASDYPGVSLKEANAAFDRAWKDYRSSVSSTEKRLSSAEKAWSKRIESLRKGLTKANQSQQISSVGFLTRVTLYETQIKTPGGTYELTEGVRASAEQHGTKQVVQGWVFKSDHDRREVYLHVNGPGWSEVVPFALKNSIVDARALHQFANTINVQAANIARVRAAIATRVAEAQEALGDSLLDRGEIERAARDVQQTAALTEAVRAAQRQLHALAGGDLTDRRVKKALDKVASLDADLARIQEAAKTTPERVAAESTQHAAEAERLRGDAAKSQAEEAPTQPVEEPDAADEDQPTEHATNDGETRPSGEPNVLEQIKKLGELRELGFINEDEFEAKKADLLARL